MKRRIFAMMLTIAMIAGIFIPTAAFAQNGDAGIGERGEPTPAATEGTAATPTDAPPDSPEPEPEGAKVRFTLSSADGVRLAGAAFGIYRASDNAEAAALTTGRNGVALSPPLPAGDYYWIQLQAAEGYIPIAGKTAFTLTDGETKRIAVTNEKPSAPDSGTLLVKARAEGTGDPFHDAVFGVYPAAGNGKVLELVTADNGAAETKLAPGDYYLKQLSAPAPYVPEPDRIAFSITAGTSTVAEITVTRGRGTLRLIWTDESGGPVYGGVCTVYRQDGAPVAEVIAGSDGIAACDLPAGAYYLTEKTAPAGFKQDTGRYAFNIENGRDADVKIISNTADGTAEICFRHIRDGREIAPMRAYTDKAGSDYVMWMRTNGYENMEIDGYTLLHTDYPDTYVLIDGKLTVTLWYGDPPGYIYVPKTGEAPPMISYALALCSWGISAACGYALFRLRKRTKAG